MNQRFVTTRRVEFIDTDMAGILHFATYFRYLETAEHELFRHLGLPIAVRDRDPHVGWPRVACGFEYSRPLRFGDEVEVHLGVRRLGPRSLTYEAEIHAGGHVVARGHSTCACCEVTLDGRMTARPVPEEVAAALRPYVLESPSEESGDHA